MSAIRVEQLGKQYRIDAARSPHNTLRDQLADGLRGFFRGHPKAREKDTIWALRDVSFEVKEGEVVGIIGRNGAGKSTLLKLLSRITKPTQGRAEIRGRVGSLLEVGTGFHPELTGRENIFLNGAILGMKKAEIAQKFDEIVAFAEIERFIDTPVKRYSSGMYVRLAFAVAAHVEPEILLVDEVLAVGDAAFQEKCLGTMRRSASSGKTVLFVSHNMPSIQHLCTKAMLLESGRVSIVGQPHEVIGRYLADVKEGGSVSIRDWHDRVATTDARIIKFEIQDEDGRPASSIPVGGSVRFTILAEFYEPVTDPCFGVLVHTATGESMLDIRSTHAGLRVGRVKGNVMVRAVVETLGLYPGRYLLSPWITDSTCQHPIDWVRLCCALRVDPAPGRHGDLKLDPTWGKYWVRSDWDVQ